jgi:hypothetical protein
MGEILIAGVLFYLGYGLPSSSEIRAGFQRAERVTTQAGQQVHLLRRQVHTLKMLEWRTLAERLKSQTRALTRSLRAQPLDFSMVGLMRDAVAELAEGLGGLAESLDPAAAGRLGTGIGGTADFLEEVVLPTTRTASRGKPGDDSEAVLKDLAATLRQAAKRIDTTVSRWPELRTTLTRLAEMLQQARGELDTAMHHRDDYEETLRQTVQLAEALAVTLPILMDQFAGQLDQQDHALEELGRGVEEFGKLLPAYQRGSLHLVQTGRLLSWLIAIFMLIHMTYWLAGSPGEPAPRTSRS